MENKIINVLKGVLESNNIDINSTQSNCENWDSMHHLMLVVEIESQFDVQLQPDEIEEMKSVQDIKRVLEKKLS